MVTDDFETIVTQFFETNGIPYMLVEGEGKKCYDVAKARGIPVSCVGKCILRKGVYEGTKKFALLVFLLPGDKDLENKKALEVLGKNSVKIKKISDLKSELNSICTQINATEGAFAPFQFLNYHPLDEVILLIQQDLLGQGVPGEDKTIDISSGVSTHGLHVSQEHLSRALACLQSNGINTIRDVFTGKPPELPKAILDKMTLEVKRSYLLLLVLIASIDDILDEEKTRLKSICNQFNFGVHGNVVDADRAFDDLVKELGSLSKDNYQTRLKTQYEKIQQSEQSEIVKRWLIVHMICLAHVDGEYSDEEKEAISSHSIEFGITAPELETLHILADGFINDRDSDTIDNIDDITIYRLLGKEPLVKVVVNAT